MDQSSVFGQGLRNCLGPIVPQPVGRYVQGLNNTEFRCEEIVQCLSSLEGYFIGIEVKYPQSIILKSKLLDGIDGITIELVFPDTKFFQPSIYLQHLSVVDCTFLPDALVVRAIQIQCPQGAVVPVKDAGHANNSVNIQLIVAKVELFQGHSLLLIAGEEQIFSYGLNVKICTIAPAVPTLLCCRLRYFKDSALTKEVLNF